MFSEAVPPAGLRRDPRRRPHEALAVHALVRYGAQNEGDSQARAAEVRVTVDTLRRRSACAASNSWRPVTGPRGGRLRCPLPLLGCGARTAA